MFRLMTPRIEILAGAIGQMTSAVVPSGTERVACIFLPLRFSDTSILPKCVSTVAEASVKVPIWGQTLKERKPGEVGSIPHTF